MPGRTLELASRIAAAGCPITEEQVADWHPILATIELEPGVWVIVHPGGSRYAVVRLLCLGGELGYRAVTWAERSEDRQLIGYYRNLRAATTAAHMYFVSRHG